MSRFAITFPVLALAALLTIPACGDPPTFDVRSFEQADREGVPLNGIPVIVFTSEIDPTSVNAHTVAIRDDRGERPEGRWIVKGKELRFLPAPPLEVDLSDAGLHPDRTYGILIAGFPDSAALRSSEGRLLRGDRRFVFRTVRHDDDTAVRLIDRCPGSGPILESVNGIPLGDLDHDGLSLAPGDALRLVFSEPLLPGSVTTGRSRVNILNEDGGVDRELDAVPLISRFAAGDRRRGRVVECAPEGGFLEGRTYKLFHFTLEFTDYDGNRPEALRFNYIRLRCERDEDRR